MLMIIKKDEKVNTDYTGIDPFDSFDMKIMIGISFGFGFRHRMMDHLSGGRLFRLHIIWYDYLMMS